MCCVIQPKFDHIANTLVSGKKNKNKKCSDALLVGFGKAAAAAAAVVDVVVLLCIPYCSFQRCVLQGVHIEVPGSPNTNAYVIVPGYVLSAVDQSFCWMDGL